MFKNKDKIYWIPLALFFSFFCSSADAHDIPISEIKIDPDESQVHLELKLNAFELKYASEIDQNNDGKINRDEFEEKREIIKQRLLEALKIEIAGARVEAETSGVMWDAGSHHLVFRAHYPADAPAASLKLTSELQQITNQSHITWVTYSSSGGQQRASLERQSNSVTFDPADSGKSGGILELFFSSGGLILVCIGLIIGGVSYRLKRSVFFRATKSNNS